MADASPDPNTYYLDAFAAAQSAHDGLTRRFARLGAIRLAVFLVGLGAAASVVLNRGGIGGPVLIAAATGFVALVVWHERIARRQATAAASVGYYRRGLDRLSSAWRTGGDQGDRFRDDNHLFATDLELFGPSSLFHYLSTASTETGAATLAGWLLAPADPPTVARRQEAARELAGRPAFRHDLAVAGWQLSGALDSSALRRWLESPPLGIPGWAGPVAAGLAVANLGLLGATGAGLLPGLVPALSFATSLACAGWLAPRIRQSLGFAGRPVRELDRLTALLRRAAGEQFTSPHLKELVGVWGVGHGTPAWGAIGRLALMAGLADARRNQLFAPVAALLLLGTQLGAAIERWRLRSGPAALRWLDAVGEFEALASLATFAFDRPDAVWPVLIAESPRFDVRGLAHPLLPAETAIRNDFTLGQPVRLAVISGSNMSGKSTLLKAVGVNLALAYAGAPVVARSFQTGPFDIGASLVLRESLLEGRSRFYAEILRLKAIVARAEAGRPVFFLLDELLSGTNSHDRALGARSILDGLVDRGAIGVITTHDLALASVADLLGERGANWHLEDQLIDGRLVFDYSLKPGVVRTSNALALMRAVGLSVAPPGNDLAGGEHPPAPAGGADRTSGKESPPALWSAQKPTRSPSDTTG